MSIAFGVLWKFFILDNNNRLQMHWVNDDEKSVSDLWERYDCIIIIIIRESR